MGMQYSIYISVIFIVCGNFEASLNSAVEDFDSLSYRNISLTMESSTFNESNSAWFYLVTSPTVDKTLLEQIDMQFRTSRANDSHLLSIFNQLNESLTVEIQSANEVQVRRKYMQIPEGQNASVSVTEELILPASGVANGSWHHLTMNADNNGSLLYDGLTILDQLLSNFTHNFPWGNSTTIEIAGSFQGCIANVSLDNSLSMPLHSKSDLLNVTDYLRLDSTSRLPDEAGCREAACPCEPNGMCIYRQWDLVERCNCTRGYTPDSMCKGEWDTCENLDTNLQCQNGGTCFNKLGVDAFGCNCSQDYLGSRCQSFNLCRACQNNAADCKLIGNVELPESLDYNCTCAAGYSGRNCTIFDTQPGPDVTLIISVTVGVIIAVLIIAIAVFVAVKIIRDRRRDSGAYRPSRQEVQASRDTGMAMSPAMRPPKDERLI